MSSCASPPAGPIEVKVLPLDTGDHKVLSIDAEDVTVEPVLPKLEDGDSSPFELFKQRMAYEIMSLQMAKNSQIISEAKASGIIQYLKWRKNPADFPNLKLSDFSRHTIREYTSGKRMVLIDVPDLSLYNVLAMPKKTDLDKCVSFSDYRRVVHAGQLFEVVHHLHTDSNKNTHCGYRPVYDRSKHEYFGIPRSYIRLHCKFCPGCVVQMTVIKPQQPHKQPVSWSLEKKVFLVKEFYRNRNSIDCVLKNYREKFGRRDLPRPQTIHQLVRMFEETGSVFGSVLSPEQVHLASLHKSHHRDDKLPLDTGCWWTSENGCTTKSEPLCT